jgi:hypothetical protein
VIRELDPVHARLGHVNQPCAEPQGVQRDGDADLQPDPVLLFLQGDVGIYHCRHTVSIHGRPGTVTGIITGITRFFSGSSIGRRSAMRSVWR